MVFLKMVTVRNISIALVNVFRSVVPYRCPDCKSWFHYHLLTGEVCDGCRFNREAEKEMTPLNHEWLLTNSYK